MVKVEKFLSHLQIFYTDHKFLRSVTSANSLTWWYSWKHLEDIFARRLEDVLKTFLQDVLKTSWRLMAKMNILVLIKTSWRRLLNTKTKNVFKKSSRRLCSLTLKTKRTDVLVHRITNTNITFNVGISNSTN